MKVYTLSEIVDSYYNDSMDKNTKFISLKDLIKRFKNAQHPQENQTKNIQ